MFFKKLYQSENARYLCACFVGFCVHYGSVNALTLLAGWWHIPAALISLVIGYSTTFVLLKFWTFSDPEMCKLRRQIWQYFKVSTTFYSINMAALYLVADMLGVPYFVAQPIISVALTYRSLSFERKVFT